MDGGESTTNSQKTDTPWYMCLYIHLVCCYKKPNNSNSRVISNNILNHINSH